MRVRVRSRWVQKAGNQPSEFEDAFFPVHDYETEAIRFRAAAADGATESSFSGEWAWELARGYGLGRLDPSRPATSLATAQRRWQARVSGVDLPWYAQEKLRQGAFSTLLGLTVWDGP